MPHYTTNTSFSLVYLHPKFVADSCVVKRGVDSQRRSMGRVCVAMPSHSNDWVYLAQVSRLPLQKLEWGFLGSM